MLEVVRPMIKLLHPEKTALENYEALMALTNLSHVDASVRKRIFKEQGMSNIENFMFETDEDLRVAGTECICNLVKDEDVSEKNNYYKNIIIIVNKFFFLKHLRFFFSMKNQIMIE